MPTVHACVNKMQSIIGKESVNVSVNNFSHMARCSTEAVQVYSKRRARNCEFLQLKRFSNQSRIVNKLLIFLSATIMVLLSCSISNSDLAF